MAFAHLQNLISSIHRSLFTTLSWTWDIIHPRVLLPFAFHHDAYHIRSDWQH